MGCLQTVDLRRKRARKQFVCRIYVYIKSGRQTEKEKQRDIHIYIADGCIRSTLLSEEPPTEDYLAQSRSKDLSVSRARVSIPNTSSWNKLSGTLLSACQRAAEMLRLEFIRLRHWPESALGACRRRSEISITILDSNSSSE